MSVEPCNEPTSERTANPAVDPVELVIRGRPRDLGTVTVARLLPAPQRRMVGPVIFLDHMGPMTLAPGVGFDVRPHPHIGLSTVTYFLSGRNVHRDSMGNTQINVPGDVNVMTAGRGVVHSERAEPEFRASGGVMHGLQIWLALTDAREDDEPSFEHHPQSTLPVIAPAPGATGRVLIGDAFGAKSPIVHASAPLLVDLELEAGATIELGAIAVRELGVAVITGDVRLCAHDLAANDLAVLHAGVSARLTATSAARVLVLGGEPVGQRFIEWNFVASSRERIDRAKRAWHAEQFPLIPSDHDERIPLPQDSH